MEKEKLIKSLEMRIRNLKNFIFLALIIFLVTCESRELRLIGITSKFQESFFYGKDFTVSALRVDKEKLEKIRIEIKNAIAVQQIENPKEKWQEINEISLQEGIYIYFQIIPETRVPNEFLEFQFKLDQSKPLKVYSYYGEFFETNMRSRNYYPGPFYIGGFYGDSGGFVYPLQSRFQEKEISQKILHTYNYLVLFSDQSHLDKSIFRVTTPSQNLIDFEFNSQR